MGVKPYLFDLPQEARTLIDNNALAKLRGESTEAALDGHLGLCRIKVAAALALLHNERNISSLMWELSGVVMDVSQETRAGIERHLAEQAGKANIARGKAEGARAVAAQEVRDDANIQKASRSILRILGKDMFKGEGAWGDVRRDARRDREYFEPAVDALVAAGQVEVLKVGDGRIIRVIAK